MMRIFCPILDVKAREILDSRGNPTVEAEVICEAGITGVLLCLPVLLQESLKPWSCGTGMRRIAMMEKV